MKDYSLEYWSEVFDVPVEYVEKIIEKFDNCDKEEEENIFKIIDEVVEEEWENCKDAWDV